VSRTQHICSWSLALSLAACNLAVRQRDDTENETSRSAASSNCDGLPSGDALAKLLNDAAGRVQAGGLFGGHYEWGAVVNRAGELCAVAVSTEDASAAWPGSQAIAKAKAFTANAFSTDDAPLSTARLYTLSQPGHSLWGIGNGNPFNPACMSTPAERAGIGKVCGGTIAFGGGVPLYRGGKRIGGLGASGDTACADHEIAKTLRDLANLNPAKGRSADDIQYSQVDGATLYSHPLCPNTWRDGVKLGDEELARGY
jgi:uncharacterized protein GlcG (DUF336 family)